MTTITNKKEELRKASRCLRPASTMIRAQLNSNGNNRGVDKEEHCMKRNENTINQRIHSRSS